MIRQAGHLRQNRQIHKTILKIQLKSLSPFSHRVERHSETDLCLTRDGRAIFACCNDVSDGMRIAVDPAEVGEQLRAGRLHSVGSLDILEHSCHGCLQCVAQRRIGLQR